MEHPMIAGADVEHAAATDGNATSIDAVKARARRPSAMMRKRKKGPSPRIRTAFLHEKIPLGCWPNICCALQRYIQKSAKARCDLPRYREDPQ